MKIKTWLLLSYFIVMILPIGAIYGLYVWINAYYQDQNVAEYINKWSELQSIKEIVSNPLLYEINADYNEVEQLTNDKLAITLYTKSGLITYSSNPLVIGSSNFTNKDTLFKDLYTLSQKYNTFTYKEPVFVNSTLIGIYEVTLIREEWVTGVSNRTWLVAGLSLAIFIILFIIVTVAVNRKLNHPLTELMQQMRYFAKGDKQATSLITRKDEIGELATSFVAMQIEIEAGRAQLEKEQQQKEFMIASISHDLKTPLTSIQAYAEALQKGTLSETEQQEYKEVISFKSDYMKQMLDDLLMYTLLQSSNYEMELITVDGAEFFDMLMSDYKPLCDEKNITLNVTTAVTGDYQVNPKQLMRVVDNIMANAILHTPVNGEIGLAAINYSHIPTWCFNFVKRVCTKQSGIYLIVQNSGSSVSQEDLTHVFEPLYQADRARTKAGSRGTGLGLSITKQILNKHGGTVEMVSQDGIGTALICWLPPIKKEILI